MMTRILLIEDNAAVRENTAELLELSAYEVISAEDGREGVRKAQGEQPDLIICDIMMPELDGYGVLHILSKNPDTAGIPFIFLTARSEKSDVRKGMSLGADDYITKPFSESELLDAVESRLKRSQSFQQNFSADLDGLHQFIDQARGQEELRNLASDRRTRTFKNRETLFSAGDYPGNLYYVISGRVKTSRMDPFGKDLLTDFAQAGDFLGYMPLLEKREYSQTATALEPTEVAVIPAADFQALIEKNRDAAHCFIKLLARNVREKEERLLKATYASVRERVADAILRAAAKLADQNAEPNSINLSREDLAGLAGTATETLIRTLSEFKAEDLIEVKGRRIIIRKQEALEAISL